MSAVAVLGKVAIAIGLYSFCIRLRALACIQMALLSPLDSSELIHHGTKRRFLPVWTKSLSGRSGIQRELLDDFPFLEFPLLYADVNLARIMLQSLYLLMHIAIFNDLGEDLQPETLSQFHFVPHSNF